VVSRVCGVARPTGYNVVHAVAGETTYNFRYLQPSLQRQTSVNNYSIHISTIIHADIYTPQLQSPKTALIEAQAILSQFCTTVPITL
jgi:hypothetical protein